MTSVAGLISHKDAGHSCHVTVLPGLAFKKPGSARTKQTEPAVDALEAEGTPPAAREQVLEQNDPIRLARRHGNHLLIKPYYGVFLLISDAFIQQKQLFWIQEGAFGWR